MYDCVVVGGRDGKRCSFLEFYGIAIAKIGEENFLDTNVPCTSAVDPSMVCSLG